MAPDVASVEFQTHLWSYISCNGGGDSGVPNDNWSKFLNLVASVESESYGGYKTYNLGGSAQVVIMLMALLTLLIIDLENF